MKKWPIVLLMAVIMAAGAVFTTTAPSQAQFFEYATPPQNPFAQPWVGPNTPWTYYNGDWFLNGILYYFFGSLYGWAPYYAYPPVYIVRPPEWYAPRWLSWYRGHPRYWEHFRGEYPYWRNHRIGERYNEKFYMEHHHGQPGGWQKGFQGRPAPPARPEGQRPGAVRPAAPVGHGPASGQFAPPPGQQPSGPHMMPQEGQQRRPGQMMPQERREPARMAPSERPAPGGPGTAPAHMAPPATHGPTPGQGGAPAMQRPTTAPPPGQGGAPAMQRPATTPAPAPKAAPAPQPGKPAPAPGAPPAEKGGHGEEKR